jgi:phosphoglycerate kinase
MNTLSLKELPVKNKKVLMRVDFNVPLDPQGNITDDSRIVASIPSIRYVLDQGGSLILMSHLGRPDGKVDPKYTLAPCAKRLSQILKQDVVLAPDCIGPATESLVKAIKPGQVVMLENLRFHPGEEHPDKEPGFVDALASLGDVYVNDAFGTAHRAHASTVGVPKKFPGKSAAGFLMDKEIFWFNKLLKQPHRPFCAMIGGAKISTKCQMIEALIDKADEVLIGGGMTYTFMKAQGIAIGNSIHEDSFLEKARELINKHVKTGKLVLPVDIVVADRLDQNAKFHVVPYSQGIPDGYEGVDIGPDTIELFAVHLEKARTVFWNGPFGVFEVPQFAKGTGAIAHVLAQISAETVVGGGDSIAAVQEAGVSGKISHISTGGGAALELVEFGTLPGIEALVK